MGGLMGSDFYQVLWKSKLSGVSVDRQLINRRKNGEIYNVLAHISPIKNSEGQILGWIATEEDISPIKKAEADVVKSSSELDNFFQISQDIMGIANTDGFWKRCNPAFIKLLGYPGDELLKSPFLSFIHPDDIQATQNEVAKLGSGANTINFLNRYRKADGSYAVIQWNATPFGTDIFATGRDVSEIKEQEMQSKIQRERLEQITTRFTFATESAKIGIWEWDVINNRLVWDDLMYRLYGIKQEQFSGAYDAWQAGLHPEDKKLGDDAIQQALAGEKEFDISFRVVWPDKSVHYIKAYGVVEKDDQGVPQRMVGVNWDITEDKLSELKLKQFEAVVRDTDDAVITKTLEGVVTGWNSGAQKLYGYTAKEMIGKSISIIIPPEHNDLDELLKRVSIGERIPSYATIRKRKNGSLVDVAMTISPIHSDDGGIVGASVVARDSTKEKIVDKEKTEFVSLASHQLKTPIGSMEWNLEMLISGDYGQVSDQQKEILSQTYTMSKRMNDLVNALLNISRIDTGVFIIEPEALDWPKLCDEVLVEMEPRRVKKGHELIKDFQENLPQVSADLKLLRIVFQNFISNAMKYSPDNGNIKVSLRTDDNNIIFSVANNGEPIPKAEQSKIFGKMFRASNAQQQDPEGNGLGLYMVKQIVENGGGKIWFTSSEGEDTVFSCSFPLSGMIEKSGTKQLL